MRRQNGIHNNITSQRIYSLHSFIKANNKGGGCFQMSDKSRRRVKKFLKRIRNRRIRKSVDYKAKVKKADWW